MDHLIDPITLAWTVDLINAYIHPDDVKIIRGLVKSQNSRPDSYGWMFTETGKYTVKSCYKIETLYPDKVQGMASFGPDTKPLSAFTWKLKCSPKLRHFVWQVIPCTIGVAKNLQAHGIECETRCSIYRAEEESVNHILSECPLALQTWALSKIRPRNLPTPLVFTNMNCLFSRLPTEYDFSYFPWILWYIWKNINDKIYKNIDGNPQKILRAAEVEGEVWSEAQLAIPPNKKVVPPVFDWQSLGLSRICFIDGVWKEQDSAWRLQSWQGGIWRNLILCCQVGLSNLLGSYSLLYCFFLLFTKVEYF